MPRPKPSEKMIHVNLSLPTKAWRAFRAQCILDGTSASKVLASAIAARLAEYGATSVDLEEVDESGSETTHA